MSDLKELDSPTSRNQSSEEAQKITREANELKLLVQKIIDTPDVDKNKVKEIKQLIANNELPIDSQHIAKAIVDLQEKS